MIDDIGQGTSTKENSTAVDQGPPFAGLILIFRMVARVRTRPSITRLK